MKLNLLIIFFFAVTSLPAQSCYQLFLDKGISAFNGLDFERAINQFNAAKVCDDLPADNDIDSWISKAQSGYIDAIKAEQVKSQSLGLTARSILELLKKSDATRAYRYAQYAFGKDDSQESRAALYEVFYQLESDTRKNVYVKDVQVYEGIENRIETAGFLDKGKTIYTLGDRHLDLQLFSLDGQKIANLKTDTYWYNEHCHNSETGMLLANDFDDDGKIYVVAYRLKNNYLDTTPIFKYGNLETRITAMGMTNDGQKIVVGGGDNGEVHVLNAKGELLYELPKEKRRAKFLSFSKNNEVAITYDNLIKVFRLGENEPKLLWEKKETKMFDPKIVLSPNANFLMTASGRRSTVWSIPGDSIFGSNKNLPYQETIGHFSADEKFVSFGDRVINLKDLRKFWHYEGSRNTQFSPDLRFVAAEIGGSKAQIWRDPYYNQENSNYGVLGGHKDFVNTIRFSPDSTHLLTTSSDRTLKIWNIGMKAAKSVYGVGALQGVFETPDGLVVSTSEKESISFFDIQGRFSHRHGLPVDSVLTISSDGKYIFANGETEGSIEIWSLDLANKSTDYRFGITGTDPVKIADFFTDERVVLFAESSNIFSLQLWDFSAGKSDYLSGYLSALKAIRCSPDNKHLVATDIFGQIYLWETIKGKPARIIKQWNSGHELGCNNVNFSSDGKYIITAGQDNVAAVWDFEGNQKMRLADHTRGVLDIAYSPDGKYIITTSLDRTTKIWSAEGELIVNLEGYNWPVTRVRFSSDGKYIITNHREILYSSFTEKYAGGAVMIWPFDPKLIIEYMEGFDLPDLSDEEKAKYDVSN